MYQHFVQNASLAPYSTYHIGGKARYLAFAYDTDGLMRAMSLCPRFVVLGRGSKALVSDEGFDGTVILMRNCSVRTGTYSVRNCDCSVRTAADMISNTALSDMDKGEKGAAFNSADGAASIQNAQKTEVGSGCGDPFARNELAKNKREAAEIQGINKIEGGSGCEGCGDYNAGAVYAEAGVGLPYLSRWYAMRGLSGLEWACSIPGSVGGALRLNAGAYGGDMAQIVLCVDVLRGGKIVQLCGTECGFAYRHSGFYPSDVVVGAWLKAENGDGAEIMRRRQEFGRQREAAQPKGFSCGSVFRAGDKPAYKYIEECGLKGLALGGAEISAKHGNFIINKGGAKARDVYNLIRTAKAEVFCKAGVRLFEEVVYVGEF